MKRRGWIVLSGLLWLAMGSFLFYKGLCFIAETTVQPDLLCERLQRFFGTAERAANILIALGLFIGLLKSCFVLVKTVRRVVSRIAGLPLPIRLKDAYSPSYWILIGAMMALGITFRFLPISIAIRGTIDIAIGMALIQGALLYFRAARSISTCDTDSRARSP